MMRKREGWRKFWRESVRLLPPRRRRRSDMNGISPRAEEAIIESRPVYLAPAAFRAAIGTGAEVVVAVGAAARRRSSPPDEPHDWNRRKYDGKEPMRGAHRPAAGVARWTTADCASRCRCGRRRGSAIRREASEPREVDVNPYAWIIVASELDVSRCVYVARVVADSVGSHLCERQRRGAPVRFQ
jgi:hypothetical protein